MYALLITSFIWALSFGLLGNCMSNLAPDFVAMMRMVGALLVFLPFMRRMALSPALSMLGIGALQFGGMYVCYIASFRYLPSYQVALLTATTPIYIVLMNAWVKKHLSPLHLMAALLVTAGGAVILWKGQSAEGHQATGILLVQLSNICFALGQLAYVTFKNKYPTLPATTCFTYAYLGGLLVTLPTGAYAMAECLPTVTLTQWWILGYLGIIASGLCFFLWNYGACRVNAVKLAIMNNLKIPLAALTSLLLFQEAGQPAMLLYGCLLIAAAFPVTLKKN